VTIGIDETLSPKLASGDQTGGCGRGAAHPAGRTSQHRGFAAD